jgi:hypothetical protein
LKFGSFGPFTIVKGGYKLLRQQLRQLMEKDTPLNTEMLDKAESRDKRELIYAKEEKRNAA